MPDSATNEEILRQNLRAELRNIHRREPLEPTFKRLLLNLPKLAAPPILPRDKFYRRVGSNLRGNVESFLQEMAGKDPFDRLQSRQPLEEAAMRAALTLREAKEHEQQALLEATLAAIPRRNGMDETQRKRFFEAMALGLQSRENKSSAGTRLGRTPPPSESEQTEAARKHAEWEKQRAMAKSREDDRKRREEEDRKRAQQELERKRKAIETPQQGLHKIYYPIFIRLWEMEFSHLGNTNPFRMVIDRDNCASMGAPDYFDVIEKPMNLTYIQSKVDAMEYDSLKAFFDDCELMLKNAILYNSDLSNPYRIAAEEMKTRYIKMKKKMLQTIQEKQRK